MAYTPNKWVDREGITRYFESVDDDGALILTPDYTQVTEMGTPVNSDNMNHIEEGIAAGSFTKYDSKTTYAKDDLVTAIVDGELKVYKSLQGNNNGQALTQTAYWVEVELGSGGGTLNMFDTVLKDHILSFEESKGLALQGTYVYKDAIAGSRYGYPTFYNQCVEEFQNASKLYDVWVQPTITENGTIGGDSFAVSGTAVTTEYEAYRAFDNNSSTDWVSASANEDLIIYTPIPIMVTKIDVTNRNDSVVRYIKSGVIYGSNDNSNYVQIGTFTNTITTQLGEWSIDLGTNNSFYKYYKFSLVGDTYCSANEIKITASLLPISRHPNGHLFYDIADKNTIDSYFGTFGRAWFYGVDVENERIFLPRNSKYFRIGDESTVGSNQDAGLPNITGETGYSGRHTSALDNAGTGALRTRTVDSKIGAYTGDSGRNIMHTIDASLSNAIYGNSDTVELDSVNMLLYICVGNTESEEALTNVIDITTTENDTIPLFTGMYFDFKPNNVSWLKGGEAKQSGGVYTFCYNELVKCLNEADNVYNLKVINEADMIAGVDYSEYWKVNQDNMTFTTPTAISNKALSGAVKGNGYGLGLNTASSNGGVLANLLNDNGVKASVFQCSDPDSNNLLAGSSFSNYYSGVARQIVGITTDPTKSGIIAEQSTAQLYFKVANAVQNLELLNAGEVMEAVNDINAKVDNIIRIVESYRNGRSGYNIYSNGYCEQWGWVAKGSTLAHSTSWSPTVSLLKPYATTDFVILLTRQDDSTSATSGGTELGAAVVSTSQIMVSIYNRNSNTNFSANLALSWKTCGYIA